MHNDVGEFLSDNTRNSPEWNRAWAERINQNEREIILAELLDSIDFIGKLALN